jgi:hypothetical protein
VLGTPLAEAERQRWTDAAGQRVGDELEIRLIARRYQEFIATALDAHD